MEIVHLFFFVFFYSNDKVIVKKCYYSLYVTNTIDFKYIICFIWQYICIGWSILD